MSAVGLRHHVPNKLFGVDNWIPEMILCSEMRGVRNVRYEKSQGTKSPVQE